MTDAQRAVDSLKSLTPWTRSQSHRSQSILSRSRLLILIGGPFAVIEDNPSISTTLARTTACVAPSHPTLRYRTLDSNLHLVYDLGKATTYHGGNKVVPNTGGVIWHGLEEGDAEVELGSRGFRTKLKGVFAVRHMSILPPPFVDISAKKNYIAFYRSTPTPDVVKKQTQPALIRVSLLRPKDRNLMLCPPTRASRMSRPPTGRTEPSGRDFMKHFTSAKLTLVLFARYHDQRRRSPSYFQDQRTNEGNRQPSRPDWPRKCRKSCVRVSVSRRIRPQHVMGDTIVFVSPSGGVA